MLKIGTLNALGLYLYRMERIVERIALEAEKVIASLAQEKSWHIPEKLKQPQVQLPPNEMDEDFAVVLFPYLKPLGMSPEDLGQVLGEQLKASLPAIESYQTVRGFLNLKLRAAYWNEALEWLLKHPKAGFEAPGSRSTVLMEYPSPNTNKPLHLGHLRNIFLGSSLASILEAKGHTVVRTNLFNDRGTNISKSMAAYLESKEKLSPEEAKMKGDALVGAYYVEYNRQWKEETEALIAKGLSKEEAQKQAPIAQKVDELTIAWEKGDSEVRSLWQKMNDWFYQGVNQTFEALDLKFDKVYFESDVYNLGRATVQEGLKKGVFFEKEDGSVWIDLTDIGLDEKLVLRSNGTTVYMTQDIALAYQKQQDFDFERAIYVVGNEQDYHFKVLFEILKRLGLKASDQLFHLSYGMVELPTGKMKSREGTVVDADDLIETVTDIAREKASVQGRLNQLNEVEQQQIWSAIGLGALRYFILRVDPKKRMVFNPKESIDFQGNTGPFIQYMHARCCSVLRNASTSGLEYLNSSLSGHYSPDAAEWKLVRLLSRFPEILSAAARNYSPSEMANYAYQLASAYSSFYHDHPILRAEDTEARDYRLALTKVVADHLAKTLSLLCMEAPEQM